MNGRFLLDTNIVIALFGQDQVVHEHLADALEVFVPSIVTGELYYGAYRSQRAQENLSRIEEFARVSTVLPCDTDTARRYASIKNGLRIRGQPLPENDLWIAALAQQYGLTLVTRDRHFEAIEDLRTEAW